VRDIELSEDQHDALRARNPIYNQQLAGRGGTSARRRAERRAYEDDGRVLARRCHPLLGLSDDEIRLTCNLFADYVERQHEVEGFSLHVTGLPRSSLCRSIVNVYSKYSFKKRTNKLPYGTCRVIVNRTRVVQSIYGAIQEYGGFERPEWLNA
jgi:hypothetical protein